MDARLQAYVERIRALAGANASGAHCVERALDEVSRVLDDPCLLAPVHRYLPAEGCGRHLVHRDSEHGFVVLALVWPPGYDGDPHDHGTWGVMGVLAGELQVTMYARTDDRARDGHGTLRQGETLPMAAGSTGHLLPPDEEFHRIANPGTKAALSLHTYGREIRRCRVFDIARKTYEYYEPTYTTAPRSAQPAV